MKRTFLVVLSVLIFSVTALGIATLSGMAGNSTLIYKIDFEEENAGSVMNVDGETIGEVVEWPAGSGNHALKYIMNPYTYDERNAGRHPYIYPTGLSEALTVQGNIPNGGAIHFTVSVGCEAADLNGRWDMRPYLYPMMLTGECENYFTIETSTLVPGADSFNTTEFSLDEFWDPATADYQSGPVALFDDETLGVYLAGKAVYYDDITLEWYGDWKPVTHVLLCYPGTDVPLAHSDINDAYNPEESEESEESEEIHVELTTTAGDPTTTTTPGITTTAGETAPATTTGVVSEADSDIPAIVSGDVNNDSFVDMKDVLALRKFLAGMDVQINALNADANEDGSTNMKDVLTIRKRLAHLL